MNIDDKLARLDELRENRAQIDREIGELFGVYEGDDETAVRAEPLKKNKGGRPKKIIDAPVSRGTPKPCCGSTGPRHFKTCTSKPQAKLQHLDDRSKNEPKTKLTEDEFDDVKHLKNIGELSSLSFSQEHRVAISEVNRAITSRTYDDYLNF